MKNDNTEKDTTKEPVFVTEKQTYDLVAKENPKDKIEVEIGDSKEPDVILPQAKIQRWDNEINVSIRLKDFNDYSVIQDKEKVIFGNELKEVYFYQKPEGDGANEIEVILKEKPKSNVVEFTLVDKDVEYFYQPELTSEEKLKGLTRPKKVVGSYAVYSKTKKINYVGGKEYKCGKVGHIYRPKIIDSAGTEVWGDLKIENGILSVTIPQDFLDKAVYPVKHAAGLEFGYQTNGGSTWGSSIDDLYCQSGTAASNGNVDSISFYASAAVNINMKGVLVLASNKNIVSDGVAGVKVFKTLGWYDSLYTSKPSVIASVGYYASVIADNNGVVMRYDSVPSSSLVDYSNSYTTPTNPTDGSVYTDYSFSIYATYTEEESGTDINDNRNAKTTGKNTSNSARQAKITGKSTTSSGIDSKIFGKAVSSSERNAKIIGIASQIYTREAVITLPDNDTDLATVYNISDLAKVVSDDNEYVDLTGSNIYFIHQFKQRNNNNTDQVNISIILKSDLAPSSKEVFLQVYNRGTEGWEEVDSDNSADANEEFTLSGLITGSLENYYDENNWVSFRVYQNI